MAKRKKGSKVQKRARLRRGNSAKRGKPRKVATTRKRRVAKAKPKRAPVKKAVQKEVAPAVAVEKPVPAITVTEGLDPAA